MVSNMDGSEHDGMLKDVEYGLIYLYILVHIRCGEALFWKMMDLEKITLRDLVHPGLHMYQNSP